MITLAKVETITTGAERWQASYDVPPDVVAGVGQVSRGITTIGFTHATPDDAMRFALIRIRQNDQGELNLKTFDDWTAIAAVLGADYANKVFEDFRRGI